ncbi:MAG TPA: gephyrin-like molybdotransferase Glp [Nitrososphaeraceae archaeon]
MKAFISWLMVMMITVVRHILSEEKRHGPKNHMHVHIALKNFFSCIDWSKTYRPTEFVPLADAQERVLSNDVASYVNLPPFAKAERDGYAVKSKDTTGASIKHSILLKSVGRITAGQDVELAVESGKAVAIATGAKVPRGADAVIMIEHTKLENNNIVKIFKQIERGKNISVEGEDVKNGQILLKKGTWLSSQDLGLMASVGLGKVPVYKKPEVAILATGDELVEPGSKLDDACIYESNRYMISAMVREFGGKVVDLGICRDDRDVILSKLKEALKLDIVVVSGGASVGEKDYVPEIINNLGKPGLVVHGIAMKPGSPTGLGVVNYKPIIITPGFPVSSYLAFYTFGQPLILQMLKTRGPPEAKLIARMGSNISVHKDFRTFVRVKVVKQNDSYLAMPISASGASLLSTLTKSNGIIIVENNTRLLKGKKVEVILLRNIAGVSR